MSRQTPSKLIAEALKNLTMETASFSRIHPGPDDPLPKTEAEVTDFIRRRTAIWRGSWVIPPLEEALEKLTRVEHKGTPGK